MEIHLDFETRSHCNLKVHGAWIYSRHTTTDIICLAYAFGDAPVKLAYPDYPGIPAFNWVPKELLAAVADRKNTVHAHNAFFERSIWENICVKKLGWPDVLPQQWRCTLSIAAYHALPRGLDGASKALGLPFTKDLVGNKVMLKCSKPTKSGEWHEVKEDLETVFKYCMQDVEVERGLEQRLEPLPQNELAVWHLDQEINKRGILFDRALADSALRTAGNEKSRANIEMFKLTKGAVKTTTERKAFGEWTWAEGYDMTDKSLKKELIPSYLTDPSIPKIIKDAIKLRTSVSMASVNKYKAILNLMDSDNRIRDGLRYFGASTGRWAGKGVQIQNFPRGYSKEMDDVCSAITDDEYDYIDFLYGDSPMEALKKATRGAIIASPGHELFVADYNSVEARGLMWLVGDEAAIKVFNEADIYCDMASDIYSYEVLKGVHYFERQLGKQAILGCGYGMGYVKFFITILGYGITLSLDLVRNMVSEKEYEYLKKQVIKDAPQAAKAGVSVKENLDALIGCKYIVNKYRDKYPLVKQFWKDIEEAALNAMHAPGEEISVTKLKWCYRPDYGFLQCELPSGRKLNYPAPQVEPTSVVTFYAVNSNDKRIEIKFNKVMKLTDELAKARRIAGSKGYTLESDEPHIWASEKLTYLKPEKVGLVRMPTYGGKLAENVVQAICRDLMAYAMLNAEKHEYPIVMTVHDEICAEVKKGTKKLSDFESLICELPDWADGFPIGAEGFVCTRYRK